MMAITYDTTIDQGANWYINFIYNQPVTITNISGNGTTVTYTTEAQAFSVGQIVSITGVIPSQYNLQNVPIATRTSTQFTITNPSTGTYISGGVAYAPVNLTGYTAALQLRSLPNDPTAALTLTTANGGITITALTGTIAVSATATQTRAIDEGYYYYDLEITQTSTGIVTRVAQGQILVSAEITR
jgi:hypothetical protein